MDLKKIFSDDPEVLQSLQDKEIGDLHSEIKKVETKTYISLEALKEELKKNIEDIELQIPEKGDQGIQGEKGDKGEDGLDGIDGKDGKKGFDGIDGKNGKDGKDGSPDKPP